MAAILDAMGPYVMQLIADMATEEVKMLLGISGDIEKLENNMESIKCFLADAERKRITELRVQRWVQKLKNAMYDATDILDLCQIEADKQRESKGSSTVEKAPGCCQPLLSCLWNPVFAHKIGGRIKELNQRLDNIYEEAHKFNFINLGSHPEQRMSTREKVTSEFVESAIVGEKIERETRELAQMLTINGRHDIKVVAIVGTGGMGKTTLAQKIFNDTTVQGHFKVKIWLSITQHFDEVELLRTAIEHAGGVHDGMQDKTLLSRRLTNTLSMEFMSKEESLVVQDQEDDGGSKISHLRHLRYLHFQDTNISRLPGDIHRMKFLQHIWIEKCPQLDHLPSCITQLLHLRTLSMYGSHDNVLIPKGFGQLKNLRTLLGFRVHLDKNGGTGWCSLEEIGPLSQLRKLSLHGLENVPASSSAGMAMVSSKEHLDYFLLKWSSIGFMELRDEINKQQQQRVVEESPSSLAVGGGIVTTGSVVGFPNLATLRLAGLCEWEEWEWEEQGEDATVDAMAVPALKVLEIRNYKLSCLPPGLASSRRHALRKLCLYRLSNLTYIENFPSVVELQVFDCPELIRISNLSKLQNIVISYCPNMEVLGGVSSLDSMEMEDGTMETVPEYVTTVRPRYLKLTCSKELYESLLTGSSSEYDKISHIKSWTICAEDED
ncbi:uncharacterized protein [Miscanthus floridulus]|uniref:uncharacterized protein n=1 Tax=Miscanthus floridulus TaxID=154761 RepID=UPI0034589282